MPVLSVLVEKSIQEKLFFDEIKRRTKEEDMVKNPFRALIREIPLEGEEKMIVYMNLEPFYPKMIPLVGVFLAIVGIIFGWIVFTIAGAILASFSFAWTPQFFYWVLKRSRKKHKVTGGIVRLKSSEALERVVLRGTDRDL